MRQPGAGRASEMQIDHSGTLTTRELEVSELRWPVSLCFYPVLIIVLLASYQIEC